MIRIRLDYLLLDKRMKLTELAEATGIALNNLSILKTNKARAIRNCCRAIAEKHGGGVPRTMTELLQLDGVGRKTANVVLGTAFGIAEGIVVDTHVARLSRRMGLTRGTTPEKIEQALMKIVPRKDWIDFSHLLIWHGRRRCTARRPDCAHCEIVRWCPRVGVPKTTNRKH